MYHQQFTYKSLQRRSDSQVTMGFFYISLCFAVGFLQALSVDLEDTPTLGSKNTPRFLSKEIFRAGFNYQVTQNHSVFSYQEDSEELYVGGTDFVLRLDVNDYHIIEKLPLKATGKRCREDLCENVITVIERFQDSLFVCGTNGNEPKCWKLFPSVNNQSHEIVESYEGTGISPFVYTQNSLSLAVDGDLYAAAPLDIDGNSLQFRRIAGSRTNVWMYDKWVSEPTFISTSWVQRGDDPDNEKIYIFFREKNSDHSPEADPWISQVARVCKVDEGGSKRFFQNMWTSFLKARLVCGFPEESLYFNRLQDIYVLHADDWHDTRVYALFTSSWNSTAVCIYSVEMIEQVFENSTFRGYDGKIPIPRPGTCVRNSRSLPQTTVSMVKDYPEMTDWVHSLHYTAPFYISSNNYTKIAVDRVHAADQHTYNILLLATDSGKIHKVLEAGSEPFIISETQLSNNSTIQAMKLDSEKKKLVVGFSEKISTVDLERCEEYTNSCAECVLARDPYCAWTAFGCTQTVPGGIQNIMDGEISVCDAAAKVLEDKCLYKSGFACMDKICKYKTNLEVCVCNYSNTVADPPTLVLENSAQKKSMIRSRREEVSALNLRVVHSVPQGVPFYLSCPIDSYHALYTWEHGGHSSPCLQMLSNCLHLIPSMTQENYGNYDCISREKDYTKVVKPYELLEQKIPDKEDTKRVKNVCRMNKASGLVPRKIWITLQFVAVLRIFS